MFPSDYSLVYEIVPVMDTYRMIPIDGRTIVSVHWDIMFTHEWLEGCITSRNAELIDDYLDLYRFAEPLTSVPF